MSPVSRILPWALPLACLTACGQAPAPVKAPAPVASQPVAPAPVVEAPDGPVPPLRTGALAPVDDADVVTAQVVRHHVEAGFETLLLEFERDGEVAVLDPHVVVVHVEAAPGAPELFAFAAVYADGKPGAREIASKKKRPADHAGGPPFYVWIRRPASAAGASVAGDFFQPASGSPGRHTRFRADDPATAGDSPLLALDWTNALASQLGRGPWQSFAQERLGELARRKSPAPRSVRLRPRGPRTSDSLAMLMETTTGAVAIQEALQQDRGLFLSAAHEGPTVPISSVKGPELARQPWTDMLKGVDGKAHAEPLASSAPAEFYYVRAAGMAALLRLLDQADTWGSSASYFVDQNAEDHDLRARYEAELGLERGPLARVLGPAVISEVALVGSDPYVKEGSDVTLLFRVKEPSLFDAAMKGALANHAQAHGAIATEKVVLAGLDVTVSRSADKVVRQHRARVDDIEIVSNSPAALTRVLETIQGKHPKLADEVDFQFMLARDARTRDDVLAYMGDRFVAEVVGPRQKIGEARREIALAELTTPGFAALLYGWMNGKSPGSTDDLVRAGLLAPAELSHARGGAIAWRPSEAARSDWGTPAALTPLLDTPVVDRVTESERLGYERFARGYQSDWATYIDPVAVRVAFDQPEEAAGSHLRMTVDLRELPLLDRTKYGDITEQVGKARFAVNPVDVGGLRAVLALGEGSELRQLLGQAESFSARHELKFDWVGDWAMVGILDRSRIAEAALGLESMGAGDDPLQPPAKEDERAHPDGDVVTALASLPIYAAIGIRNPVGAALALVALRGIASTAAPGLIEWGEAATHRDVPVVKVEFNSKKVREQFGQSVDAKLFYALAGGAFLVALNEATIDGLIDDRLDGKGPSAPADKGGGTQMALDFRSETGKGLWTSLMRVFEGEMVHDGGSRSRADAEALLRGAPERAGDAAAMRSLALAYFGAAPRTLDGAAFAMTAEGLRDPVRGTAHAPVWPPLPVPGSPVEALMSVLTRARADLSFDDEGHTVKGERPLRSLHARVTLDVPDSVTP